MPGGRPTPDLPVAVPAVVPPRAGLRRDRPEPARIVGDLSFLRMAGLAVLFLAGLLLAALALECVLPEPAIDELSDKLYWYERHRSEIDTVVIGSSRVYRQIAPEIFDPAMEELGFPSSTFNLGAPSMKLPEMEYLLRRILRPGRPNPERVFMAIESRGVLDLINERNEGTERVVYWHDLPATCFAIEAFWTAPGAAGEELSPWTRATQTLLHARMALLDAFNVSQGVVAADALAHPVSARRRARVDAALDRNRGWVALTPESPGLRKRHESFLRNQGAFEARVERKRALYRDPPAEEIDPDQVALLDHMAGLVRAVGAEPVFFVAPNPIVDSLWMTRVSGRGRIGAVFVYGDPERYPELYDASHYFDKDHLNREGARLLTERLANDYAAWKRSPGRAPENPAP